MRCCLSAPRSSLHHRFLFFHPVTLLIVVSFVLFAFYGNKYSFPTGFAHFMKLHAALAEHSGLWDVCVRLSELQTYCEARGLRSGWVCDNGADVTDFPPSSTWSAPLAPAVVATAPLTLRDGMQHVSRQFWWGVFFAHVVQYVLMSRGGFAQRADGRHTWRGLTGHARARRECSCPPTAAGICLRCRPAGLRAASAWCSGRSRTRAGSLWPPGSTVCWRSSASRPVGWPVPCL